MEWFLFVGGALVVVAILLARTRAGGSEPGASPHDAGRPGRENDIDLARLSSGRGVNKWPGENRSGGGIGVGGSGGDGGGGA